MAENNIFLKEYNKNKTKNSQSSLQNSVPNNANTNSIFKEGCSPLINSNPYNNFKSDYNKFSSQNLPLGKDFNNGNNMYKYNGGYNNADMTSDYVNQPVSTARSISYSDSLPFTMKPSLNLNNQKSNFGRGTFGDRGSSTTPLNQTTLNTNSTSLFPNTLPALNQNYNHYAQTSYIPTPRNIKPFTIYNQNNQNFYQQPVSYSAYKADTNLTTASGNNLVDENTVMSGGNKNKDDLSASFANIKMNVNAKEYDVKSTGSNKSSFSFARPEKPQNIEMNFSQKDNNLEDKNSAKKESEAIKDSAQFGYLGIKNDFNTTFKYNSINDWTDNSDKIDLKGLSNSFIKAIPSDIQNDNNAPSSKTNDTEESNHIFNCNFFDCDTFLPKQKTEQKNNRQNENNQAKEIITSEQIEKTLPKMETNATDLESKNKKQPEDSNGNLKENSKTVFAKNEMVKKTVKNGEVLDSIYNSLHDKDLKFDTWINPDVEQTCSSFSLTTEETDFAEQAYNEGMDVRDNIIKYNDGRNEPENVKDNDESDNNDNQTDSAQENENDMVTIGMKKFSKWEINEFGQDQFDIVPLTFPVKELVDHIDRK